MLVALGAVVALAIVFTTDQVLSATSAHQAQLRVWLGSRAAGLVALLLLTFQVVVGLARPRAAPPRGSRLARSRPRSWWPIARDG